MYDVTRMMKRTLSDYQSSMKRHFEFYNSNDDIKAVKKKPYRNVSTEDWTILCEYFVTPEFQVIYMYIYFYNNLFHYLNIY
ncbi:hypothetical protein TorRG33x02_326800 [Trema orientale]|uniref:Uncharacterized protein n=1 Tax=Trema orientale TaxID=63057 RepID=A0A2P5BBK2_TREOI|nr:hypothetical protein TorRG33x02_326800 [Trema orientale]